MAQPAPRNMKVARRHEAACPGSAGILPATGRRHAVIHTGQRHALCGAGSEAATPPIRTGLSWERGHLARNGPKARGCPCRPEARALRRRLRGGDSSDTNRLVLGARASCPQRAEGTRLSIRARGTRSAAQAPRRRLLRYETACPGSAGILPATGRRPAVVHTGQRHAFCGAGSEAATPPIRSGLSWERGHLARNGPKARGCPCRPEARALRRRLRGGDSSDTKRLVLGARASCPQRAEGPRLSIRARGPRSAAQAPRRRLLRYEAACPGSAGILPATGRRPAVVHAGQRHAFCGAGSEAATPPIRSGLSWERGHLARNGPKARGCPCRPEARAPGKTAR